MSEFTPITINSQDELNAMFGERVERAKRIAVDEYKKEHGEFEAERDALNEKIGNYEAELNKLSNSITETNDTLRAKETEIERLNGELSKYVTDTEKTRIAREVGLDIEIANTLTFTDAESFRNTAQIIAEKMAQTTINTIPSKVPTDDLAGNNANSYRELLKNL